MGVSAIMVWYLMTTGYNGALIQAGPYADVQSCQFVIDSTNKAHMGYTPEKLCVQVKIPVIAPVGTNPVISR